MVIKLGYTGDVELDMTVFPWRKAVYSATPDQMKQDFCCGSVKQK